jgi:hypothetical protein
MYDDWRAGFARRPLADAVDGLPAAEDIVWLPPCDEDFQYLADPFGVERDGVVTVFAEAYDYRTRRGEIRYFQFDGVRLTAQGLALAEPFHLSYPAIIEDEGRLYMLPEAHKSGALTLYACARFPDLWVPAARLLDAPAIDATVTHHNGRWWMFYSLPGPDDRAMRELHVAWSDRLTGPWRQHAANPVRTGFSDSRPGGSIFERDGRLHLPVQDCDGGYGRAVQVLRIDELTPTTFAATPIRRLQPDGLAEGFDDGLHTLSGDETLTLVDVKGLRSSRREAAITRLYKARRLFGLNGPRRPNPPRIV